MVCPHFCPSTLVLISYSAPWSIQWNGCSGCWGLCLYNTQPDSYFPSSYAENRGYMLCWCLLWPRWPNTLATTLGQNVLSPGFHSQKAWGSQWLSFNYVVGFNPGGSLVDGLGELSGSRLLSLQRMMSSMEGRIEDHKQAFPTNKLLLLLLRAMQDSFTHLNLLKTMFTEMRIGVSNFQHYYLEIYGSLDYIENYKPCIEGARPPAESVANCMGAIMNIPHIVQDFYMAGLPVDKNGAIFNR